LQLKFSGIESHCKRCEFSDTRDTWEIATEDGYGGEATAPLRRETLAQVAAIAHGTLQTLSRSNENGKEIQRKCKRKTMVHKGALFYTVFLGRVPGDLFLGEYEKRLPTYLDSLKKKLNN
jgi:hypothetical protein